MGHLISSHVISSHLSPHLISSHLISSLMTNLILTYLLTLTLHSHSLVSLSTLTLHPHSPPSLSTLTLHSHSPLSLSTLTLHSHSPLSLYARRMRHPGSRAELDAGAVRGDAISVLGDGRWRLLCFAVMSRVGAIFCTSWRSSDCVRCLSLYHVHACMFTCPGLPISSVIL